jgi:hypothetical protein
MEVLRADPQQGGNRGQATYRSRVERTLDGKLDPPGSTLRTYDPAAGKWRMRFLGATLGAITEFERAVRVE